MSLIIAIVRSTCMPVSWNISSDIGPAMSSCTSTSSFSLTGAVPVEQTDQASAKKNELSIHVMVSFIDRFASTWNERRRYIYLSIHVIAYAVDSHSGETEVLGAPGAEAAIKRLPKS